MVVVVGGGGEVPIIEVAQNGLKHVLVLEFLRSNMIWGGGGGASYTQTNKTTGQQPYRHYGDQISRSAREKPGY